MMNLANFFSEVTSAEQEHVIAYRPIALDQGKVQPGF